MNAPLQTLQSPLCLESLFMNKWTNFLIGIKRRRTVVVAAKKIAVIILGFIFKLPRKHRLDYHFFYSYFYYHHWNESRTKNKRKESCVKLGNIYISWGG